MVGDSGEARRSGAGAGSGDDGGFRLAEEPLDGLAVGLVAELARELEDAGGADDRHANAAPAAVDLAVAVLGRRFLDGEGGGGGGGGGGGSLLVLNDCVVVGVVGRDGVSGSIRVGHVLVLLLRRERRRRRRRGFGFDVENKRVERRRIEG